MYSLSEVLNLFDLDYDISMDGLKRAKKRVLMMHPDKSKLPPTLTRYLNSVISLFDKSFERDQL